MFGFNKRSKQPMPSLLKAMESHWVENDGACKYSFMTYLFTELAEGAGNYIEIYKCAACGKEIKVAHDIFE